MSKTLDEILGVTQKWVMVVMCWGGKPTTLPRRVLREKCTTPCDYVSGDGTKCNKYQYYWNGKTTLCGFAIIELPGR